MLSQQKQAAAGEVFNGLEIAKAGKAQFQGINPF
jgi:hypothetical protein